MNTFEKIKNGIPDKITIPVELEKLCNWFDENGFPISGYFQLQADTKRETMRYWLGFDNFSDRFGIFGSGPDGSLYSFWIDDEGVQKIVHLGSEGGQLYVLAHNFVDFLRLLAIGYDEIGFADLSKTAPEWLEEIEEEIDENINPAFRAWVEQEYNVTIPERGNEIVDVTDKSFNNWIKQKLAEHSK